MLLKFLVIITCIFTVSWTFSQGELPSNNFLLSKIFGIKVEDSTYSRAATKDEINTFDDGDSLTYQIVFKELTRLNHEKYLIVITQAEYGSQHGHQIGNTGIYFFQPKDSTYTLSDSIVLNSQPIGITPAFEIINIGQRNKALLWTFESRGNQHHEKTISFHHILPGQLDYLFSIESEYSNVEWRYPEDPEEPCDAYSWVETYSIRTSDAEWYDVIIERIEYDYEKGCIGRVFSEKFLKKLIYKDGQYTELAE